MTDKSASYDLQNLKTIDLVLNIKYQQPAAVTTLGSGSVYKGNVYVLFNTGDNCRRDPRICDVNAQCELSLNMYVCVCNTGYRGDGKRCVGKRHDWL